LEQILKELKNKMVIGHEKQKKILEMFAKNRNIPHAMLFSGGDKVGKKKLAIEFVKSLFCEEKKGFCGKCYSCRNIDTGNFPDLVVISPVDGNIEIATIRDLENRLSLKSYSGSLKVGIIDDAHLMRKDVQNALLKTLEEPKGDTLLILITSYPEMLLPTIRSRVEQLKFSFVGREKIEKNLISLGAKEEKAKEIAMISSGQIGKAIEFYQDEDKLKFFNEAIRDIISLIKMPLFHRFAYVKQLNENPEDIIRVLDVWERFFRREMLLNIFNGKGTLKDYNLKKIKDSIEELGRTKYLVEKTNTNKKLALENLLIQI
jgi:DNA polymerase-3 subunit delta'